MSRRRLVLIFFLLLFLASCAPDARTRLAQQRDALTAFQASILDLNEAGTIDDETFGVLGRGSLAASGYLTAARAQLGPAGASTPEFERQLERAQAAMQQLYAIEAERNVIARGLP